MTRLKYNCVGAVSLGCSKNTVDTEIMLGELSLLGFTVVSDAAKAEIIIINTCGFITSAKQDSIDTVFDMLEYKKRGSCKLLIVTGCLSQRYRDELIAELPEVDMFWGVKDYPAFARTLFERCVQKDTDASPERGKSAASCFDASAINAPSIRCGGVSRLITTPPYRAYLRIADGCDNRCTYCAIPLIRGGRVSVPIEKLTTEAEALAASGVTELTVIAQDTSAYGVDLYGKPMLKELLSRLSAIESLKWIRLLYAYPNTVTPELIDFMRDEAKICSYIDLPIQHISKRMLTAMNRHGSAEHIREIVAYIRKNAPDFIIRTTVMLGFPGESEADFDELSAFLAEQPFDRVGAFTYSAEDGTPAAELPEQVPSGVAEARLDAIMRRQAAVSLEFNKRRIGQRVAVLIESVQKTNTEGGFFAVGRSYAEAADVDGVIKLVPESFEVKPPKPGDYVFAVITGAEQYDLEGVILEAQN